MAKKKLKKDSVVRNRAPFEKDASVAIRRPAKRETVRESPEKAKTVVKSTGMDEERAAVISRECGVDDGFRRKRRRWVPTRFSPYIAH
jgi:hypothetical protein